MIGNAIRRLFAKKSVENIQKGLDGEVAREHLKPLLEMAYSPHKRTGYKPVTEPGVCDAGESRFNGGPAWLAEREGWPACSRCNNPMEIFAQIDLDAVPEDYAGRFGSGLLQLFYCVESDCAAENSWEHFDETMKLVRIVDPNAGGAGTKNPLGSSKPRRVTDWQEVSDWPGYDEAENLGVKWDWEGNYSGPTRLVVEAIGIRSEPVSNHAMEEACDYDAYGPATGDKLGGWPYWVQNVEYPGCPECGAVMQLVLQIDSNDNVDYMFGDVGVGHITQCPKHKHVVAFGWACS